VHFGDEHFGDEKVGHPDEAQRRNRSAAEIASDDASPELGGNDPRHSRNAFYPDITFGIRY
jgi:hypothetical protein